MTLEEALTRRGGPQEERGLGGASAGSGRHHLWPSFVLAAEQSLHRRAPAGLVLGVQMSFQMPSTIPPPTRSGN